MHTAEAAEAQLRIGFHVPSHCTNFLCLHHMLSFLWLVHGSRVAMPLAGCSHMFPAWRAPSLAVGECHWCPWCTHLAVIERASFAGVAVALCEVDAVSVAILGAVAAGTHISRAQEAR